MTKDKDILWLGDHHSVVKRGDLYEVLVASSLYTHMTTEEAYAEPSVAIARAEYLDRRAKRIGALPNPS